MGGGQDPEAGHGAGDGGEKKMAHSSSSGPLPPSEPPHLRGQDPAQYQYGTFHPPAPHPDVRPHPPVGFPQPAPPPGFAAAGYQQQKKPYAPADPYYAQGYQAAPGYGPVVQGRHVEGRPMRMRRLPCCGLGMGWLLFIAGFFLAAIPWYIGAFVLICVRVHDHREKPGYVACTVAAIIAAIVIPLGVTKGTDSW